jgi:histone H3/H4
MSGRSKRGKDTKKNMNSKLLLQISRVRGVLKRDLLKKRTSPEALVYLTGVTEYILEEVLKGAKKCLDKDNSKADGSQKDKRRHRLSYKDVAHAICNNEDLKEFFADFHTTVVEPKPSLCVKLSENAYQRIVAGETNNNITVKKLKREARFCGVTLGEEQKKTDYAKALLVHHYPYTKKPVGKKKTTKKK